MERRGFVVLQLRVERRSRAYKARALTIELLVHKLEKKKQVETFLLRPLTLFLARLDARLIRTLTDVKLFTLGLEPRTYRLH